MSFIKRIKVACIICAYFIIGFAILGIFAGIPVAIGYGCIHWAWIFSMLAIPVLIAVCGWLIDVLWNMTSPYAKIGDQKSGKDFCRKYRKNH